MALLHCPGSGLPLALHQCLTSTHLLQEAFLHVFRLDPSLFLLSRGRWQQTNWLSSDQSYWVCVCCAQMSDWDNYSADWQTSNSSDLLGAGLSHTVIIKCQTGKSLMTHYYLICLQRFLNTVFFLCQNLLLNQKNWPWTCRSGFFCSELLARSLINLIDHSVAQFTHELEMTGRKMERQRGKQGVAQVS